jgi:hypothetical protein
MTAFGVISGQTTPPPVDSRACVSSELGILNQIRNDGWNMAVWNREMPVEILEAARIFVAGPVRLLREAGINPGPVLGVLLEEALADRRPALRRWQGTWTGAPEFAGMLRKACALATSHGSRSQPVLGQ